MNTIGTRHAAQILGVSPRYVRTLIDQGRITPRTNNGHHRIDQDEIERLARERSACKKRPS